MPEIVSKIYKDLGVKLDANALSEQVKETFKSNMEGQNPQQCLLIMLYIILELYRQIQNDTISEKDLSPEFLELLNKHKVNPMYG